MDAPVIDTLGPPVTLVRPRPAATFACVTYERDDTEVICWKQVAALGLCWPAVGPWPALKRPTWSPGRSIVAYGAEVMDVLVDAGRPMSAVLKAAALAYSYAVSTLPQEAEVKATEDFSEAPTGG